MSFNMLKIRVYDSLSRIQRREGVWNGFEQRKESLFGLKTYHIINICDYSADFNNFVWKLTSFICSSFFLTVTYISWGIGYPLVLLQDSLSLVNLESMVKLLTNIWLNSRNDVVGLYYHWQTPINSHINRYDFLIQIRDVTETANQWFGK